MLTSIAELFAAGNYTTVAMTGSRDQWQTCAAIGLIGKTQEAIEGLSRFNHPEARFYSAVASWMDGDETTAVRILKKISTPHAQNLLALIRKPRIRVLAQLPWSRIGPSALITAAVQDDKFTVQNITFHHRDLRNEPYADIHKFYDSRNPPDFYICQMVEWHVISPNLQELPCPIFGQTADYDLHIQVVYPWLQVFDELVVTDQTEWQDVSRLVGIPVSTFPKSFGVADRLPSFTRHQREIEVFMSGTVLHPYHPDKAKLYHEILRMPDIKLVVINGFVPHATYYNLLAQSKLCLAYYRRYGGMVTRGLEALAMGCTTLIQQGNVMKLYVGEQEGVLTYELEAENLVPTIRRVLDEWPEFEQRAHRGAEIIRREFALQRVASQYLRFLTFLAAKPRSQRQIRHVEQLSQKRSILWKGWVPGGPDVFQKMRKYNLARWQAGLETQTRSHLFIDMARELVLEYATPYVLTDTICPANKRLLTKALNLYRTGLVHFPKSLVLRFNLIRTALHFGQPQDISEALQLAEETLSMPASSWQIDVMEDVFPWDFCNTFFNYRRYFDLITEHLMQGTPVSSSLAQLILASLHYYLGRYFRNLDHFKQAVIRGPDFPFYKLWYAKQLLERDRPGDNAEAESLLVQLVANTIVFVEAYYLLRQLQGQQLLKTPQLVELTQVVDQAKLHTIFLEDLGFETLQPLFDSSVQLSELPVSSGVVVHKCRESQMPVKVSVILLDWPCHKSSNALDSLSRQNIPRDQYELVLVEFYGRMVPEEMEKTDVVISCGQDGLYHKHVGYNVGLLHTKGQVIAICDNDAVFPSDFVASIIASFNLNFSNKPSSIVLIHDQQRTSEQYPKGPSDSDELQQYSWINSWSNVGACMSVRKIDAIRFGGFDEHVCFLGYFGGFYDLGRRLVNASISEVRHDWSTTLRYLAHPYLPASFDQSFSWKLWHTVAYPTIEHQRTSFEGRLLPFKENPGVHKLRMSLRRIGTVYKERHAAMVGLSGFSKGERLQLYLTVLWETCKVAIIKRNKWLFDVSKKALRRLIGPRAYGVLRSWWRFLRGLDVEDVVQIIECPLPIDEQTRVDAARD